jgi:hypothetical protein
MDRATVQGEVESRLSEQNKKTNVKFVLLQATTFFVLKIPRCSRLMEYTVESQSVLRPLCKVVVAACCNIWATIMFSENKRTGTEVHLSPPLRPKVKKEMSYASITPTHTNGAVLNKYQSKLLTLFWFGNNYNKYSKHRFK